MRTAKILAIVIASVLIGSTPVASLNASPDSPEFKACPSSPLGGGAISLLGSTSGIALVSSGRCSE
jgi:hypothetical protein